MKKLILLGCAVLFASTTTQAQFVKKLKNRVKEKVENRVIEKVSDEAAQKADRQMDKVFDAKINPFPMSGERLSKEDLPAGYSFDYLYEVKIETRKDEMNIKYYLKENQQYFGADMEMEANESMFMVYDIPQEVTLMYMESEGQKLVTAINLKGLDKLIEKEAKKSKLVYTKIPGKNILGYDCQGLRAEDDKYIMEYYFATNVGGPSFSNVWKMDKNNVPQGFDITMIDGDPEKALMMEMNMTGKKNKKHNTKMTCVKYEPASLSIQTSDYEYPY